MYKCSDNAQNIISMQEKHALIEWVEDESLSVVCCEKVNGGLWTVGKVSRVSTSGGVFMGLVTATGM